MRAVHCQRVHINLFQHLSPSHAPFKMCLNASRIPSSACMYNRTATLKSPTFSPFGPHMIAFTHEHRREGQGTMNHANGDQYKGSWLNDQRHGSGTCQVVRLRFPSRTPHALLCCQVSVLTFLALAVCQLRHFCGQLFWYPALALFHSP